MKTEMLGLQELNQARSKPDPVDQPVRTAMRTARAQLHHYTVHNTVTQRQFFSIFPFLQTNITSQMWPSGGNGANLS